ncbi:MAG: protein kinase [Gloeomargarita sp. GMQP_bins_5]
MNRLTSRWRRAVWAGGLSTGLVLLVRALGGWQPLDLASYDLWLRRQPSPTVDERFLLIHSTDDDRQRLGQKAIGMGVWQKLLFRLAEMRPRVIAIALPATALTEEAWSAQLPHFQVAHLPVVVGCPVPWGQTSSSPLPLPVARVGEPQVTNSSLLVDHPGGWVRRYPLGNGFPPAGTGQPAHSLGLLVAVHYLHWQGITARWEGSTLVLGRGQWRRWSADTGPYQHAGGPAWQMPLVYRPGRWEMQTLWQALHELTPAQVQGRIVFIGADGISAWRHPNGQRQPAIVFHAQAAAQILDQALTGQPAVQFWPEPWESLWLVGWGVAAVGVLVGSNRRGWWFAGGMGVLLGLWMGSGSTWIPLVGPLLVWVGTWGMALVWPQRPVTLPTATGSDSTAPLDTTRQLWEGVTIGGRYLLHRHLGGGGRGDVFRGEDQHLGKPVAVKILTRLPVEATASAQIIRRFQREIDILARLKNIHVVQVNDSGLIQNRIPFYVMEYLQGQSLGALIRQEAPLAIPRTLHILLQVCQGLAVAHDQNIVHRDLKPDNIYLVTEATGAELVKILDFGIARVVEDTQHEVTPLTGLGCFLGTYRYASPEQCDGRACLADQRADVYSLGLIAYEMLTATNPFGLPNQAPRHQWLRCHVHTPPIPLTQQPFGAHVPPLLAQVVMTCLAKRPADRYRDAGQVKQALQAVVESLFPKGVNPGG